MYKNLRSRDVKNKRRDSFVDHLCEIIDQDVTEESDVEQTQDDYQIFNQNRMESKFTDKIGERERTLNKEFEKIQYDKKYEEFNELKQQMNRNINKILKKDSEENNLSTVTNNTQKNSKNTLNESNTKHTDFPD